MLAACGLGVDLGHFIGLLLLTLVIIKLILPFVHRFNVFLVSIGKEPDAAIITMTLLYCSPPTVQLLSANSILFYMKERWLLAYALIYHALRDSHSFLYTVASCM